nr:hypothetical protein Iba_chr11aCG14510 [Ipomoea batatas]
MSATGDDREGKFESDVRRFWLHWCGGDEREGGVAGDDPQWRCMYAVVCGLQSERGLMTEAGDDPASEVSIPVSIVKAFLFAVVLAVFSAAAKAQEIEYASAPSPDRKTPRRRAHHCSYIRLRGYDVDLQAVQRNDEDEAAVVENDGDIHATYDLISNFWNAIILRALDAIALPGREITSTSDFVCDSKAMDSRAEIPSQEGSPNSITAHGKKHLAKLTEFSGQFDL